MTATDRRDNVDAPAPGEQLSDLVNRIRRLVSLDIHVAAPGVVESYNAATSTAKVTLGFLRVQDPDSPLDPETPDAPISIPNVHVAWPRGGGAYDTWPLAAGDTGLIVFTDRALDEWYRLGGAVDPVDGRAHELADAVFFPGLTPNSSAITPATDTAARVIEATEIKLGRLATQYVALADLVDAELAKIATTLATGSNSGGPVVFGTPYVRAPVGATKVKAT